MSDEQEPWTRQEKGGVLESNLWYDRFLLYLHMGPARSLLGAENEEKVKKGLKKSGTGASGAWRDAAKQWKWKERAEAYDDFRRKQVFTQGNAYDVVRVEKLDALASRLEERINTMLDQLPQKPKKPWFNHFMYQAYLATQEAIAAETGGRVKTTKQEVTGKDGGLLSAQVGYYPVLLPQKEEYPQSALPDRDDEEQGSDA